MDGITITNEIIITLIVLIITMILFLIEKTPISFTSMLALSMLSVTGILSPTEAFAGFTDTSVLLFMAMFILGEALFVTGASQKIGLTVLRCVKTERHAMFIIMIISGAMSGILSNTSTAAIFIPICLSLASQGSFSEKKLLMGLVLSCTLGGSLTLVGTPPNAIASSALIEAGIDGFGFLSFLPVGLPIFLAGILYYVFIGSKLMTSKESSQKETIYKEIEYNENNYEIIPKWKSTLSIVILIFTVLAMMFENQIGIPFHISAWIGAVIVVLSNIISAEDAYKSLDISTILLFVGTLAIGKAMEKTGAGALLAQLILSVAGDNPIVIMGGLLVICTVLTNFMSNTATSAMLAPIGIFLAIEIGADPRAVVMAIVYGCASSYATPIGSPPNTMVYGIGNFKFVDYIRSGVPMILITFIISMFLLPYFFPFHP